MGDRVIASLGQGLELLAHLEASYFIGYLLWCSDFEVHMKQFLSCAQHIVCNFYLLTLASFFCCFFSKAQAEPISPRLQWNENNGYCGEVSFISAGLYYGQYLSQYDARSLACNGGSQTENQLLLGINDQIAAPAMRLNAIQWQGSSNFLAWVKEQTDQGYLVSIGVYTNEYRFYEDTDPSAGDDEYDHIVPVLSIGSDSITFSDNGLWAPQDPPVYIFTYPLSTFLATREQANDPNGPIYSLSKKTKNYASAITGIIDLNNDTLRVSLTTNCNYEYPEIAKKSNARPAPMPLTLNITIQDLQPDVVYNLYRFNDFAKVPTSNFNAHASDATRTGKFKYTSGSTYSLTDETLSDTSAIYRCVKASAP